MHPASLKSKRMQHLTYYHKIKPAVYDSLVNNSSPSNFHLYSTIPQLLESDADKYHDYSIVPGPTKETLG